MIPNRREDTLKYVGLCLAGYEFKKQAEYVGLRLADRTTRTHHTRFSAYQTAWYWKRYQDRWVGPFKTRREAMADAEEWEGATKRRGGHEQGVLPSGPLRGLPR
jgi:hypothetical protein